jgi:RNA polymerase sigma factor (sigma-70 family)
LIQRYARLVHSVPVRYGLTPAEVDDVGQDVFVALAQQLHQVEDPERLPAWLVTTARRISWRALHQRRIEAPAHDADITDSETPSGELVGPARMPTMAELLTGWDRLAALDQGMAQLAGRCRQLLTMVFLDPAEPSYDEISAALGMPKGSIGPTRNRCLAQLRAILEGLGYAAEA